MLLLVVKLVAEVVEVEERDDVAVVVDVLDVVEVWVHVVDEVELVLESVVVTWTLICNSSLGSMSNKKTTTKPIRNDIGVSRY